MGEEKDDGSIKQIEGGGSVNELIDTINGLSDQWNEMYGPIKEKCKEGIKNSGMDKTPGSNIKHVILGSIVAIIADAELSVEDLKKAIKITDEEPYLHFEVSPKWMNVVEVIPAWIKSYFEGGEQVDDLMGKFEEIPDKATDVGSNAPSEFEDLDFMAKAKMLKDVAKAVSKVKDKVEEITDEMKALKAEAGDIKDVMKVLKEDIPNGKLVELGKKCKEAGKVNVKDAYEHAFEPIKAPAAKKKGGGGGQGCCTTF